MTRKTRLYNEHLKLHAKMFDFAGFVMPLEYSSIIDEHLTVRKHVGIFDISHMGDILVSGVDATAFMEYILPTKLSNMKNMSAKYTAFLDFNGYMIDDSIITKIHDALYLIVPNAATTDNIYNWINTHKNSYNVLIENRSMFYSAIAVQGPDAAAVISKMTDYNLSNLKSFDTDFINIKNLETTGDNFIPKNKVFISRTGYTGEDGFEIITKNEYIENLWEKLLNIGQNYDLKPCGLGARDTLRLEKGMLLSGQDFNRDKTPLEAGIKWIVNYTHDFIGKKALLAQKGSEYKVIRGFKMLEHGIPRHGYKIYLDNKEIGVITSGNYSPILKIGIGLGYIPKNIKVGEEVFIDIRGVKKRAEISKPKMVP